MRGTGLWSRLLGWVFGFPAAAKDIEVEVTKTVTPAGETWVRRFGSARFRSYLALTPQGMTERFWPFTFTLGLTVQDGALHYPVKAGNLGPLPLPRGLLPVSEAQETEANGTFHFDVRLLTPLTKGLLVRYQGILHAAPPKKPDGPFPDRR